MLLSALSVGEKFSLGGTTTLLGLGMTFIVLALLIGSVYLVSAIIKLIAKSISDREAKKESKVKTTEVAETLPTTDEVASPEIDEETMIAIRAAVDIYVRENATDGKTHENVTILSVKAL